MIMQTEILHLQSNTIETHYTTEPIEALITAYLIHQGDTFKITDEETRNALVNDIKRGDTTFSLGEFLYLVETNNHSVNEIWVKSQRVHKAQQSS